MHPPLRLLSAVAVVTGMALVAPFGQTIPSTVWSGSALVGVGTSAAAAPAPATPTADLVPVEPTVNSVAIAPLSAASRQAKQSGKAAAAGQGVLGAMSQPEPAGGFVVTGATWRGRTPAGLELRIRTRTDHVWSRWTTMTFDAEHGPTTGASEAASARPGTDAFVAGDVDDVQLEATSADGSVPAGLTLNIVDPGISQPLTSTTASAKATTQSAGKTSRATTAKSNSGVVVPAVTARPTIYSRAKWGAAESMRDCCVEYGEIHAAFVHHTVNANNYSAAEVPAILRGIYAYHTQSRGWRDIGYNFLIDRFGRIWEGRYGGITKPVVGAHTLNYNENAFAASAIGNFETAQPSAAMLDAYARLFAWKLSLYGVDPSTRQKVAGTTFKAISGHRDAAATACPGINLYRKIPQIIAKAAEYQQAFTGRGIYHTLVGDGMPDVLAVSSTTGKVAVAQGTAPPKFGAAKVLRSDFSNMDQVVIASDLTGDGRSDVLARNKENGITRVFQGSGNGAFSATAIATKRWAGTDLFAAPGDLTSDGNADVVARDKASGQLRLYPGAGGGTFGPPRVAAASFAGINALAPAGDFNQDGKRDLLVRGTGGVARVLFGDGAGTFARSVVVSTNWKAMSSLAGGVDLTGDGRPDIVARNANSKTTRIYANIGGSRISSGIGATTTPLGLISLSNDADGDSIPAVVSNVAGELTLVAAYRQNWFAPVAGQGTVMAGVNKVMVAGDWNRDGYVDTMAREKATKKIWLYPGSAGSVPAKKRIGGWTNLSGYSNITAVGDFNGDGWPDLMAKGSNGAVYLFTGRGDAGFGARMKVRSSLPRGALMFGLGRWTRDGAPDLGVRIPSGRFYVYPGNGPGGLDDPILVGGGLSRYNSVFAVGDVTGDLRPDLVGRNSVGDLWVLPKAAAAPGRPAGTIGPRKYAGSGWLGYRLN